MIRFIEGLPDSVVAIEVVGKVEADDYTNSLEPAVAKVIEAHGKVRILYVIGDDYEGFSPGEARTYPMAELDVAKAWLSES